MVFLHLLFLVFSAHIVYAYDADTGQQIINSCNTEFLNSHDSKNGKVQTIPEIDYQIVNKIKHDINAYTEGLVYFGGYLYESTGLLGFSTIRKIDSKTGNIIKQKALSPYYFAEGLTLANNKLIQFTLKKNIAFVYQLDTLNMTDSFTYANDAWGATNINNTLIVSDGSEFLKWFNLDTHQIIKKQAVMMHQTPLQGINEMEIIEDFIYANVRGSNCIAIIDPLKLQVLTWLNLAKLSSSTPKQHTPANLNGIAYHVATQSIFITGQNWPFIYKIKLQYPALLK